MASVASARPISLRHKPSPSHAKSSQRPLCASFRSHPHRTITAPHRSRQASIPIAPAAPPAISSRDFVPWRFSDAGRTHAPLDLQSGVRETCTARDIELGMKVRARRPLERYVDPDFRLRGPSVKDFATSRAHSMKRSATGFSVRFFAETITTDHGGVGKSIGSSFRF